MSSTIRSPSQIGVRTKYLLAFADSSGARVSVDLNDIASFTLAPGTGAGNTIITIADLQNLGASARSVSKGELYRDMGRQILIVDDMGTHLTLYREVQLVSGPSTEGVDLEGTTPESYKANIFVRVWAAEGGYNVVVARLG